MCVCVCVRFYMIIYMCMWGAHLYLDTCVHALERPEVGVACLLQLSSTLPFESGSLPDFILTHPATPALPVSASLVLGLQVYIALFGFLKIMDAGD